LYGASEMGEYPTEPESSKRLTCYGSTGYGNHGDYVFGWKDDALQRVLDSPCYVNCPTLKTQDTAAQNACSQARVVNEDIDGCK